MIKNVFYNLIFRKYINHLVISLALILIFTLSYTLYNIYHITISEAKKNHQNQQKELAKSASNSIHFYLEHLIHDLQYASTFSNNGKELNNFFLRQTDRHIVKSIFITSNEGKIKTLFGGDLPDWTRHGIQKLIEHFPGNNSHEVYYSEVLPFNPGEDSSSLYFIMLTADAQKENTRTSFTGFLISFDWLIQQFIAPLKLSASDFAWVLDSNGRLIYHPTHQEMLLRSINDYNDDCTECHTSFDVQKNMLVKSNNVGEYIIGDEPEKIMAYHTIDLSNTKWILAISTYLPDVINSVKSNFILVFISSGIAIVVIIFLGIAFYFINLRRIRAEESEKYLEQTREFQEKLNHAAKLASIGELVDSVAHEINTPTGIISAETDALILNDCNPKLCSEELRIIKDQVRRISNYTKSLLSYSRRMPFQPKMNSLVELIDECLFLLNPKIRAKHVVIEKQFDSGIPSFIFDRGRMEQVIINIINNAIDFITGNPLIIITLSKIPAEENSSETGSVLISIKDNGCGIPEANIDSIFEPFFSTKPLSNGTGLGLSISKAIVLRHKGRIEVDSRLKAGTTFKIYLPLQNN